MLIGFIGPNYWPLQLLRFRQFLVDEFGNGFAWALRASKCGMAPSLTSRCSRRDAVFWDEPRSCLPLERNSFCRRPTCSRSSSVFLLRPLLAMKNFCHAAQTALISGCLPSRICRPFFLTSSPATLPVQAQCTTEQDLRAVQRFARLASSAF